MSTEPSTGGAISGGSWGYKGGSSSSSTGVSSGTSAVADSIDLSSFTITPELTEYEGTEIEDTDPEEAEYLTEEDIAELVGKMTPEEYNQFIDGVEAFYDDQIATYDAVLNGEDGLYQLRERLTNFSTNHDLIWIAQGLKERNQSTINTIIAHYENDISFWEDYARKHNMDPQDAYDMFLEMTYEEKIKWLEENSPEYQELKAREEAYIAEELDAKVAAELGDLGITTYAEYVALCEQTDAYIAGLEDAKRKAKELKTTARYDYLPFLEAYNNYESPEFDYDTYALTFYREAYIDHGGPNDMSEDFSYSRYKALHPEVTPLQFVKLASKYTNYSGDLHDVEYADTLLTLAKISDTFPQFEKTYNFLYEQDPALALQYLKDNQSVFNNLEGQMRANEFLSNLGVADGDNDALEAILNELGVSYQGLMDGLGTFGEGLCYTAEALLVLLNLMEENRTMSAEEYKKLYILQALLPVETKIEMGLIYRDENGVLHNTDPNSIIDYTISYAGPLLNNNYELSQGLGNIAPSLLVSLYCPSAGSWLMGLSSGGNAYHGAMVEGKDYFVALLYGAFTGGSEALTQRLLGGIPGLSNVHVTSLLTYLKAIGSEVLQEEFQFIMDKIFRCIAMGEKLPETPEEWEEFAKDAVKTGAYAAVTAGILNLPDLLSSIMAKHRAKKASRIPGVELTEEQLNDIYDRMNQMAEKDPKIESVEQIDERTRDSRTIKVGQEGVEVTTNLTEAEILKFINDFYHTDYNSLSEVDMSKGYGVPKDSRYVAEVTMSDGSTRYDIIWPPGDGFTLDASGNPIKTETTLTKGQRFDRYGSEDGRNISPMVQQEDGSYQPFDYGKRALPYDASQTYGQYEVTCDRLDAATIEQAVRDMPEGPDKTALLEKWSGWGIWDGDGSTGTYEGGTKTYEGTVAPWFNQPGGATQITIPISVQDLVTLGLVRKIN